MSRIPNATLDAGLDAMLVPGTVYYLALFTTDPGTSGASGEVSGGSYARQAITFGSASGGSKASSGTDAAQSFTGMPAESGGIPYFGVFDMATGGTYEAGGTTSGLSGAISVGATIDFASGAVAYTSS
jgi:hypothetical protein